jgi:hypothetical protein
MLVVCALKLDFRLVGQSYDLIIAVVDAATAWCIATAIQECGHAAFR